MMLQYFHQMSGFCSFQLSFHPTSRVFSHGPAYCRRAACSLLPSVVRRTGQRIPLSRIPNKPDIQVSNTIYYMRTQVLNAFGLGYRLAGTDSDKERVLTGADTLHGNRFVVSTDTHVGYPATTPGAVAG